MAMSSGPTQVSKFAYKYTAKLRFDSCKKRSRFGWATNWFRIKHATTWGRDSRVKARANLQERFGAHVPPAVFAGHLEAGRQTIAQHHAMVLRPYLCAEGVSITRMLHYRTNYIQLRTQALKGLEFYTTSILENPKH